MGRQKEYSRKYYLKNKDKSRKYYLENKDKWEKGELTEDEKRIKTLRSRAHYHANKFKFDYKVSKLYRRQLKSSIERGHQPPQYTLDELKDWARSQDNCDELFNTWRKTEDSNDAPSFDRIDNSKGYTLDNIVLTTWGVNSAEFNVKKGWNKI